MDITGICAWPKCRSMPARTANVPFALRWCVLYLMQFPTGLQSYYVLSSDRYESLSLSFSFCMSVFVRFSTVAQTINVRFAIDEETISSQTSLSVKFNPWIYFFPSNFYPPCSSRFIFPSLEFYCSITEPVYK